MYKFFWIICNSYSSPEFKPIFCISLCTVGRYTVLQNIWKYSDMQILHVAENMSWSCDMFSTLLRTCRSEHVSRATCSCNWHAKKSPFVFLTWSNDSISEFGFSSDFHLSISFPRRGTPTPNGQIIIYCYCILLNWSLLVLSVRL